MLATPFNGIPSWAVAKTHFAFLQGNNDSMPGEVVAVIDPKDPGSISERLVEYHVDAEYKQNGITVQRRFFNCVPDDGMGGTADNSRVTYRVGSLVRIRCLNGSVYGAVIEGGISSPDAVQSTQDDIFWEQNINGVRVVIKKDGSLLLSRKGATKTNGDLDEEKSSKEASGTSIEVGVDGSVRIYTPGKAQLVELDRPGDAATMEGGATATVNATRVNMGANAEQQAPLGNDLVNFLVNLCETLAVTTVVVPAVGTSGPPTTAATFKLLAQQFKTVLSTKVYVE